MTEADAAAAFAAFREAVVDDFHLMLRLQRPMQRNAYVAHVVAVGAERGFAFDAEAVCATLRAGEATWLVPQADAASSGLS